MLIIPFAMPGTTFNVVSVLSWVPVTVYSIIRATNRDFDHRYFLIILVSGILII